MFTILSFYFQPYRAKALIEMERSGIEMCMTEQREGTEHLCSRFFLFVNVQVGLFRLEIVDFTLKVFHEALLNALAHRDYQNQGSVYVKHYPDKVVIENPGGFPEGITQNNIITHPSVSRNKLIAETLQRLKYVQRTGQGVDIIYRDMVSSGKPYPEWRCAGDRRVPPSPFPPCWR